MFLLFLERETKEALDFSGLRLGAGPVELFGWWCGCFCVLVEALVLFLVGFRGVGSRWSEDESKEKWKQRFFPLVESISI